MPRYNVTQSWSETTYYSAIVEVEADDIDGALQEAIDIGADYDAARGSGDSDISDLDTDDVELIEDDIAFASKIRRNLPDWF